MRAIASRDCSCLPAFLSGMKGALLTVRERRIRSRINHGLSPIITVITTRDSVKTELGFVLCARSIRRELSASARLARVRGWVRPTMKQGKALSGHR